MNPTIAIVIVGGAFVVLWWTRSRQSVPVVSAPTGWQTPGTSQTPATTNPIAGWSGFATSAAGMTAALWTNPWTAIAAVAITLGPFVYQKWPTTNETKGTREEFARRLGFVQLGAERYSDGRDSLYGALELLGPEGIALRHEGLNVIGRHDNDRNQLWMQRVIDLFQRAASAGGIR